MVYGNNRFTRAMYKYGTVAAGVGAAALYGAYRKNKSVKRRNARMKRKVRGYGGGQPYSKAFTVGRNRYRITSKPHYAKYKGVSRLEKFRKPRIRGHYGGKIKVRSAATQFDKYNRLGIVARDETRTQDDDTDCVYLMNDVANPQTMIVWSIGCLLRKLFEKAGLRLNAVTDALFSVSNGFTTDEQYAIALEKYDIYTNAGLTPTVHNTTPSDTLITVINTFIDDFREYAAGFGVSAAGNLNELGSFQLYKIVDSEGPNFIKLAELNIGEVTLHMKASSELKVQNRSTAIDGSTDAEDVANCPLQGYAYVFNGVPKVRISSMRPGVLTIGDMGFQFLGGSNGLRTFGASDSALGPMQADFKEPPTPKYFTNVKRASKVRLEAGQVKSFWLNWERSMNVKLFLKKLRYQVEGGVYNYTVVPCGLLALEDVINVNGTAKITIAAELETTFGVYCTERRRKWCRTHVGIYSNI